MHAGQEVVGFFIHLLLIYIKPNLTFTSQVFSNYRCNFTQSRNHKKLLQVLQLFAYVLVTLQTSCLCAHGLIRTSSQCMRPLTEYACVYAVMVFSNLFAIMSTSHFTQLEGVKGRFLYFMKLNRCHSANTQTQHFICISYLKQKKATESESPTWIASSCRGM